MHSNCRTCGGELLLDSCGRCDTRHPLVVKLKSGEYDGADLMQAWLLIESQQEQLAALERQLVELKRKQAVSSWEGEVDTASGAFAPWEIDNANRWW